MFDYPIYWLLFPSPKGGAEQHCLSSNECNRGLRRQASGKVKGYSKRPVNDAAAEADFVVIQDD
jgi:hypothetical protein